MACYADDNIFCFQHKEEARKFYVELTKRLQSFGLEIAEEKYKIIAFGRKASNQWGQTSKSGNSQRKNTKPQTFNFQGFTHYCSSGRNGKFRVKVKNSTKKYRASLLGVKPWIRENRYLPKDMLMETLGCKPRGHYQYYGVTDNI